MVREKKENFCSLISHKVKQFCNGKKEISFFCSIALFFLRTTPVLLCHLQFICQPRVHCEPPKGSDLFLFISLRSSPTSFSSLHHIILITKEPHLTFFQTKCNLFHLTLLTVGLLQTIFPFLLYYMHQNID